MPYVPVSAGRAYDILPALNNDPSPLERAGKLYSKVIGGVTHLFFQGDDGTIYQLTPTVVGGITELTGDVVAGPGAGVQAATIANNAVTNAKLAAIASGNFKARVTGGVGDVEDITPTQATSLLDPFVGDSGAGGTKGLVPAPAAGDASKFLAGDGTFQAIAGGGITELTGDVTAGPGAGSQAATIANNAVTNAKLAAIASGNFKARVTGGVGNVEDVTPTQATALLAPFVGDSGAGGTKGLVPAPAAGDAAAGKFLSANGTFQVPTSGNTSLMTIVASTYNSGLFVTTTPQPMFPAGQRTATLAANTTYLLDAALYMDYSTTPSSHIIFLRFTNGTAVIQQMRYGLRTRPNANGYNTLSSTTDYDATVTSTADFGLPPTASSARYRPTWLKGIIRVGNGGTWTPEVVSLAASNANFVMEAGSFMSLTPLGDNNVTVVGAWS